MNDQEYTYLKDKLFELTKLDISAYKSTQMRRRLDGFISRFNTSNIAEYCRLLENDPEQLSKLRDFIPINVSEFFRDKPQFQYFKDNILRELLETKVRLNIWSAACSCGQEPFSIALILKELSPNRKHRILATDFDNGALSKAKNGGPYPKSEIKNLDPELLEKYFRISKEEYYINDDIISSIEFRLHDLIHEPFDMGFDIILCRNVMIYFSDAVKLKLYEKFHRSLKNDGILFTGGSEVILKSNTFGFSNVYPFFYRKSAILPNKTLVNTVNHT